MASCSTWCHTTAVVNRADRRFTADVVNCCKRSATLGICCYQSSVRFVNDAKVQQCNILVSKGTLIEAVGVKSPSVKVCRTLIIQRER